MKLTKERRDYLEYKLRLSKDWVRALSAQIQSVQNDRNLDSYDEILRLMKLRELEYKKQTALSNALRDDVDIIAL